MVRLLSINGLLLLALIASGCFSQAKADSLDYVALVVHPGNPVNHLGHAEARRIFLHKKRSWPSGERIKLVLNASSEVHGSFCAALLHRTPRQYMVFLKKMLFRGQAMPAPMLNSDKEVIRFIRSNPQALGYISPESVTSCVKVLQLRP